MVRGAAWKEAARDPGAGAVSGIERVRGGTRTATIQGGNDDGGLRHAVPQRTGGRMDNVERMYRHLVRTIRTSFPQYLTQPFEVGELYQTILPYRLHRRELGLETNQDYEHTLVDL